MSSFRLTQKLSRKCRVPIYSFSLIYPVYLLSSSCGIFVTIDEPTLIHYYCLKTMVYISIHCVVQFYGFCQMHNVMCPLIQYPTQQFHCSKNPCPLIHSLLLNSWETWIFFLLFPYFCLSKCHIVYIKQTGFFPLATCI